MRIRLLGRLSGFHKQHFSRPTRLQCEQLYLDWFRESGCDDRAASKHNFNQPREIPCKLNSSPAFASGLNDAFKKLLAAAADQFPALGHGENENQSHVTFFIHGYNNGWDDAAKRYQTICDRLYSGANSLGICISFDWPSLGSILGYLPDRDHAKECAADLATVLSQLYDWLSDKQQAVIEDADTACKAKVSVISHSMGNFLVQEALASVWTRKNQPLLISLINQLVMIVADVDNDLFESDSSDGKDGDAMANLTYRITALYTGRDAVLGASAGLKHFGTRRLGRSGLAVRPPTDKDNVWDIDCSSFFPASVTGMEIHSAYFENDGVMKLVGDILRGLDRSVLNSLGETTGSAWPPAQ